MCDSMGRRMHPVRRRQGTHSHRWQQGLSSFRLGAVGCFSQASAPFLFIVGLYFLRGRSVSQDVTVRLGVARWCCSPRPLAVSGSSM